MIYPDDILDPVYKFAGYAGEYGLPDTFRCPSCGERVDAEEAYELADGGFVCPDCGKLIDNCQHEDTIEVGDNEYSVIACSACQIALPNELLTPAPK